MRDFLRLSFQRRNDAHADSNQQAVFPEEHYFGRDGVLSGRKRAFFIRDGGSNQAGVCPHEKRSSNENNHRLR